MDGQPMETRYSNTKYADPLQMGAEYQDFLCLELVKVGIIVQNFSSRHYQNCHGENAQGIEIKHDTMWESTGNLYIETAEKTRDTNELYINSGIYREDNSWLYAIGNYTACWILSKNLLVDYHKSGKATEKVTPTSKGFLLPIKLADKLCCKKLVFEAKD